jgi:hypothetical protein
MMNAIRAGALCGLLLLAFPAEAAHNFQLKGQNELCGGIGFQTGLSNYTPGGFKWFNDYSREMSTLVWLNVQFNVTIGEGWGGGWGTCYDNRGGPYNCWHGNDHFGGNAVETAVGVKLKWRVRAIPLQIHAKFGGALDGVFWGDVKGVAFGFRGGVGARYFILPTLGVGGELVHTLGPSFLNSNVGTQIYATFDFNAGVEWRF